MEKQPSAVLFGDLNMLRSFKEIRDDTLLLLTEARDVTRYSRYCRRYKILQAQGLADPVIVDELVSLGKTFDHKPVLYYGDDDILFLISRNRARLEPYFRFLMPSASLIEDCTDKVRFLALAADKQLPTPREVGFSAFTGGADVGEQLGFPCIIKPSVHAGWHDSPVVGDAGGRPVKVLLANDASELDAWVTRMREAGHEFVIQEFVPGGEEAIYSFHAFVDEQSRALAYYVGKKIRTYPSLGGISTCVELVQDDEVVRLGLEAIDRLQVRGPVKIDFKKHPGNGRYYILELNLRFNQWNYLGTASGINLPMLAYRHLSGLPCPQVSNHYRTDIKWLSFGDDLRSIIRYYRPAGEYTLPAWLNSLRGRKVYDIFAWDDPLPFIVNCGHYLAALSRRLLGG